MILVKLNKKLGQEKIVSATIQYLENNSNLVKKIISASEKGLIAYLQTLFISPVQSAFLAALEDWQQTQK